MHASLGTDPIANLSFIGDQRTVCAVASDGSLPLLSFPDISDASIFSRLLSGSKGSAAEVFTEPASLAVGQQLIERTNRVVTRFRQADACWEIMDFMVPGDAQLLVRVITATKGDVTVRTRLAPSPDYERAAPKFDVLNDRAIALANGAGATVFSSSFGIDVTDDCVSGAVSLAKGERAWIAIGDAAHEALDLDGLISRTDAFWADFLRPLDTEAPHQSLMERQALSAGLLHYEPGGGVLAAGTFGFPEAPGGERNWDYRFVWVRDSAVGAKALARLGFTDLAQKWLRFVMLNNQSCDRSPINLMLSPSGEVVDTETELDHFDGLLDARPVRVGNEASGQLQLDIFGELAFALRALCECGAQPDDDLLDKMSELLDWLADNWNRPDSSIWELRGEEKHYLFSRLMCWVAFRDTQAVFAHCGRDVEARWAELEDEIADDIRQRFWCEKKRSYMQTSECSTIDAAVIAMRLFGFLERDDERWALSKDRIREQLVKPEGVLRYPHDADDGFDSKDGTFVLCTCWWIEVLWMDGEHEEAYRVFDDLIARFDGGQMSEEVGEDGRMLGNMPQLFSHAGVIEAALRLGAPA
ncbi:MAG: glycoside hydrolase family 15 protein [Pseudomonadota bacterium]